MKKLIARAVSVVCRALVVPRQAPRPADGDKPSSRTSRNRRLLMPMSMFDHVQARSRAVEIRSRGIRPGASSSWRHEVSIDNLLGRCGCARQALVALTSRNEATDGHGRRDRRGYWPIRREPARSDRAPEARRERDSEKTHRRSMPGTPPALLRAARTPLRRLPGLQKQPPRAQLRSCGRRARRPCTEMVPARVQRLNVRRRPGRGGPGSAGGARALRGASRNPHQRPPLAGRQATQLAEQAPREACHARANRGHDELAEQSEAAGGGGGDCRGSQGTLPSSSPRGPGCKRGGSPRNRRKTGRCRPRNHGRRQVSARRQSRRAIQGPPRGRVAENSL